MKMLIFGLAALSLPGCMMHLGSGTPGSGKLVTKSRTQSGFVRIENEAPANVTVNVGKSFSVKVTIDDNLEKHLITSVEKGALVIKSDQSINPTKCQIEITMPKIEGFQLDGAGDAAINGISGDSFRAQIDGAGNLKLNGSARKVVLGIDGAGDIRAFELKSDSATATIDGAGSIEVFAAATLNANIDGAGSIRYKGDPKVTKSVDGVGSVSKG